MFTGGRNTAGIYESEVITMVKRFIVLDSDGETNFKYDYQYSDGSYFVDVYKETEFWYTKEVTEREFKQAETMINSLWG